MSERKGGWVMDQFEAYRAKRNKDLRAKLAAEQEADARAARGEYPLEADEPITASCIENVIVQCPVIDPRLLPLLQHPDWVEADSNVKTFRAAVIHESNSLAQVRKEVTTHPEHWNSKFSVIGQKEENLKGLEAHLNASVKTKREVSSRLRDDVAAPIADRVQELSGARKEACIAILDGLLALSEPLAFMGFGIKQDNAGYFMERLISNLQSGAGIEIVVNAAERYDAHKVRAMADEGVARRQRTQDELREATAQLEFWRSPSTLETLVATTLK